MGVTFPDRPLALGRRLTALVPLLLCAGCVEYTDAMWTEPPVAVAAVEVVAEGGQTALEEWATATVGDAVQLDGTQSSDPYHGGANHGLRYEWRILETPVSSLAAITCPGEAAGTDCARPTYVPDEPGAYRLQLVVTSETGLRSEPSEVTLLVQLHVDLRVRLWWDTPNADLDLHLLAPGGAYWSSSDCYFGNPAPDWGVPEYELDDPFLFWDDDDGGLPGSPAHEEIGLWSPSFGTYTVVVTYLSDHHTEQDASPWLELELTGQPLGELQAVPAPLSEGDAWIALTLQWPDLEWTVVDQLSTHEALGGPPIND